MTEPAEPIAEETDAERFMRRIAEISRVKRECRAAVEAAELKHSEAKAELKKVRERYAIARHECDQIEEGETRDYPLFPRLKSSAVEPVGSPRGVDSRNPDDPGSTFLSLIDGFPIRAVIHLGERRIETVAQLGEYTASGERLEDIDGIGPAMAEQIIAALTAFWSSRRNESP